MVLVGLLLSGCTDDDTPEGATSSCTRESELLGSTGTAWVTWFDRLHRPIRVDVEDELQGRTYYFMQYDPQGRISVLETQPPHSEKRYSLHYEYGADRIIVTGAGGGTYDLVDGRVTHFEGTDDVGPNGEHPFADYEYDEHARLSAFTARGEHDLMERDARYTYDDKGRVATITTGQDAPYPINYVVQGGRTDIDALRGQTRWSAFFTVDDQGHLTRSGSGYSGVIIDETEYRYLNRGGVPVIEAVGVSGVNKGSIVRDTGTCEVPRVDLTPAMPLPLTLQNAPWIVVDLPAGLPNPADGHMRTLLESY